MPQTIADVRANHAKEVKRKAIKHATKGDKTSSHKSNVPLKPHPNVKHAYIQIPHGNKRLKDKSLKPTERRINHPVP